MKIKWRHRQHCEWSRQQHILLYVIKWQMIHFQAMWKTKSFVKVCLKFKLPLWTKGLLIHLSPLWQLPLWHFPRWHNFPVKLFNERLGLIESFKTIKCWAVNLLAFYYLINICNNMFVLKVPLILVSIILKIWLMHRSCGLLYIYIHTIWKILNCNFANVHGTLVQHF